MAIFSNWNMQQKPSGVWRHVLRAPVHLYRWRLGFLFGERFLMLTHVGRVSGRQHQTVVEVVEHDRDTGEFIVCSGTGPDADWYRNLQANPVVAVQVRNRTWTPRQRLLGPSEAATRFAGYEQAHPETARRLLKTMGNRYDGTDAGRVAMMAAMPMVAFSDDPQPLGAGTADDGVG